jgi:DNA-binding GntR family transcriptional regulator
MTMVSGQRQERVMLLEQVYELLKEQIIDRVYGPGDKLNIDAIAREMKVSSTPVREALARLVAGARCGCALCRLCRLVLRVKD